MLATAIFALVTALPAMSAVAIVELVTVWVLPAKWAIPAAGEEALTTVAVTTPESCNVHVVLDVVQSRMCPVVGTTVGPSIVLVVVLGDAPNVNVPLPVALA